MLLDNPSYIRKRVQRLKRLYGLSWVRTVEEFKEWKKKAKNQKLIDLGYVGGGEEGVTLLDPNNKLLNRSLIFKEFFENPKEEVNPLHSLGRHYLHVYARQLSQARPDLFCYSLGKDSQVPITFVEILGVTIERRPCYVMDKVEGQRARTALATELFGHVKQWGVKIDHYPSNFAITPQLITIFEPTKINKEALNLMTPDQIRDTETRENLHRSFCQYFVFNHDVSADVSLPDYLQPHLQHFRGIKNKHQPVVDKINKQSKKPWMRRSISKPLGNAFSKLSQWATKLRILPR